jgi:hypothetical protein
MHALRAACNAQRTLAAVCRELNTKHVPGPSRQLALGDQWKTPQLRAMLSTDWYAGVWTPFSELKKPSSWRSAVPTFDPLSQRRVEPTLAWFTEAELAYWRAKLIEGHQIIRRRRAHHPDNAPHLLDGILYCAACSTPDAPVHLVCSGHRDGQPYYECSRRKRKLCNLILGERLAFAALMDAVPTIQSRTNDIVTRIHVLVAGGGAAELGRRIEAIKARRQYLKAEWIDNQRRVDQEIKDEYLDLGDQLLALETQQQALSGETESIRRAAEVMALLGGDLAAGLRQLVHSAQAAVYSAIVAEAYLAASGHASGRRVWIDRLRTTSERVSLPANLEYQSPGRPSGSRRGWRP